MKSNVQGNHKFALKFRIPSLNGPWWGLHGYEASAHVEQTDESCHRVPSVVAPDGAVASVSDSR